MGKGHVIHTCHFPSMLCPASRFLPLLQLQDYLRRDSPHVSAAASGSTAGDGIPDGPATDFPRLYRKRKASGKGSDYNWWRQRDWPWISTSTPRRPSKSLSITEGNVCCCPETCATRLVRQAVGCFGKLDVLVLNQGYSFHNLASSI